MRFSLLPHDKEGFKPLTYILALPLGFVLYLYTRIIREFVTEDFESIPEGNRRLALGFHREFPLFLCCKIFWKMTTFEKPAGWIGQNSWSGYLTALELFSTSFVDCMLSTDGKSNPYRKVQKFLKTFPNDVYIRTDSGGPYNHVRKSAIRLAIDSQRNVICFRQKTDKHFLIVKHFFAVPTSKIKTRWTREFSWLELEKLGIDEATQLVESEMKECIQS